MQPCTDRYHSLYSKPKYYPGLICFDPSNQDYQPCFVPPPTLKEEVLLPLLNPPPSSQFSKSNKNRVWCFECSTVPTNACSNGPHGPICLLLLLLLLLLFLLLFVDFEWAHSELKLANSRVKWANMGLIMGNLGCK